MEVLNAIGRRKSAVARVYLSEGTGKIIINKKDLTEFFPSAILQYVVKQPLMLQASLLATVVLLSVRNQVSLRLVVASSSVSVNACSLNSGYGTLNFMICFLCHHDMQ